VPETPGRGRRLLAVYGRPGAGSLKGPKRGKRKREGNKGHEIGCVTTAQKKNTTPQAAE